MLITDLSDDLLFRIFHTGVYQCWPAPHHPWRQHQKLKTAFNCAAVCRNWAKLIIQPELWRHVPFPIIRDTLPPPERLAPRWNSLFSYIPVHLNILPHSAPQAMSSLIRALRVGRTAFEVDVLAIASPTVKGLIPKMLAELHSRCTVLKISTCYSHEDLPHSSFVGLLDLAAYEWPMLNALSLDHASPGHERVYYPSAQLGLNRVADGVSPAFPKLRDVVLGAHPDDLAVCLLPRMAPHLVRLEILSGFYVSRMPPANFPGGVVSAIFMSCKQSTYQTYCTPYRVLVTARHRDGCAECDCIRFDVKQWKIDAFVYDRLGFGVLEGTHEDGRIVENALNLEVFLSDKRIQDSEHPHVQQIS